MYTCLATRGIPMCVCVCVRAVSLLDLVHLKATSSLLSKLHLQLRTDVMSKIRQAIEWKGSAHLLDA